MTRATVTDHRGPGGTIALVTIGNDEDKPTTLGPKGLTGLGEVLRDQRERVARGEVQAVAVTGRAGHFCAGADVHQIVAAAQDAAAHMARLGHDTLRLLGELGAPTFAFIGGPALGGGLELALHADHRTVAADVRALGLPEAMLGLVPGWGGCYLLPRLVGVAEACRAIVDRPLGGNRLLDAYAALEVGLVDVVLPTDDLVEASLAWAHDVLTGRVTVRRRPLDDAATWQTEVAAARERVDRRIHGAAPAPYRALDLVAAARDAGRTAAFEAEDVALAELAATPQVRHGVYALDLTTRRSRRPTGAPDPGLAREVRAVGMVGAGLMAAQLAVLVAGRSGVPVRMREVDDERAAAGRDRVASLLERQVRRGRMTATAAAAVRRAVVVGTDLADLADADLVIEAVTESIEVKRAVFAELETVVKPQAVLTTNTSALSVGAIADGLTHPERVLGLHFFNPVDTLRLVEVVRAEHTDDASVATVLAVAGAAGRTSVLVADRPGFVVNRILLRELGEVLGAVESGTPVEVADAALDPLGLPMGPFALLQLVGLPVVRHVLESLREDLGPRYPRSPGLAALADAGRQVVLADGAGARAGSVDPGVQDAFGVAGGPGALDGPGVLDAVLTGLADEVGRMLDERVVAAPDQIDLCLILGAGFPFHLGGLLPHLDRTGYSERVTGRRFLVG